MTTTPRTRSRAARRPISVAFLLLAALGGAYVAGTRAPAARQLPRHPSGYSVQGYAYTWPIKPFDQPHAVRANFGDPRTTFRGPGTVHSLLTSVGNFGFHCGIDIAAPTGTAVYAVRSGRALLLDARAVQIDSSGGFRSQYWHIVPAVHAGEHVVAHETIVGRTINFDHLHFAELRHGRPVNPLAPGHLGPFEDATRPVVSAITFRSSVGGSEIPPEFAHGRVEVLADVHDMPAQKVPGIWADLPVAPALITWRIERARDGQVVVPERTAFDVRSTMPRDRAFWRFYARGSHQNMARFATHRFWRQPGVYLYRLTPGGLRTSSLPNGIYVVVVTATDTRGNSGSARQVFTVLNGRHAGTTPTT